MHFLKRILLCGLMHFSIDAMDDKKKNPLLDHKTKQELIHDITKGTLHEISFCRRIFEVKLSVGDVLLYQHNREGICYFSPLLEAGDESLETIASQYLLFDAASYANVNVFRKAINEGASLANHDNRFNPILFVLQQEDGKGCTMEDIDAGRAVRIAQAPKPYFGVNTYGWNATEHALRKGHVHMARTICERAFSLLPKEEQEEQDPAAFDQLDQLIKKYDEDSVALLQAQKNAQLPTFILEKNCESFKDVEHKHTIHRISSTEDDKLQIEALITKDHVTIGCKTPIDTWKQPALDLDTLATIYAAVICFNDTQGKKIVNLFEHWNTIPSFRSKVIDYMKNELTQQLNSQRTMVPENIVLFADKALTVIPSKNIVNECLTVALRCFIAQKNAAFDRHYHGVLESMLAHKEVKTTLKALCAEEPELFNATIKPKMQQLLLREYIVQLLRHQNIEEKHNPFLVFPEPILKHIASFWEPTPKFIEGLKVTDQNK